MKNLGKLGWVGFVFMLAMGSLRADPLTTPVAEFDIFKTTVYLQTNGDAPTLPNFPNAYFFGSKIVWVTNGNDYVTNIYLDIPNGAEFTFIQDDPTFFTYNSPYFSAKTNFDANYQSGEYDYDVQYTDSNSNLIDIYGSLTIPTNDLNTIPAAFTPDCWTNMQQVYPGNDFTLTWVNYPVTDGADGAATFIGMSDAATGEGSFNGSWLAGIDSAVIPAGTLKYGHTYSVNMYYSERSTTTGMGYTGATAIVGFDNLTLTTLVTLPFLQIARSGTDAVLTWPTAADATYELETTTNLLQNGTVWTPVTAVHAVSGALDVLTVQPTEAKRFYRLAPY